MLAYLSLFAHVFQRFLIFNFRQKRHDCLIGYQKYNILVPQTVLKSFGSMYCQWHEGQDQSFILSEGTLARSLAASLFTAVRILVFDVCCEHSDVEIFIFVESVTLLRERARSMVVDERAD